MPYNRKRIISEPGIQSDGTVFDSKSYIEGQHVRFQENGYPRKMGGFQIVVAGNEEIARTITVSPFNLTAEEALMQSENAVGRNIVYLGRASSVKQFTIRTNLLTSPEIERTPIDYIGGEHYVWEFDFISAIPEGDTEYITAIVAHSNPNGNNINGNINGIVYFGLANGEEPFVPFLDEDENPIVCSGGIIVADQIIITYGNDGILRWSDPDLTWPFDNIQSISSSKIIAAKLTKGAALSNILFWTADGQLLQASYNDQTNVFEVSIIESNISLLSKNSIVNYNSIYYWLGTNQFYVYTGVVNELPNNMNKDTLFSLLNINRREKGFAIVNNNWHEIWFFVPINGSLECNEAWIYNYQLQKWYTTTIARAAGYAAHNFPYPLLTDNQLVTDYSQIPPEGELPQEVYPIWAHEKGYNKVEWTFSYAIESYFVTNIYTLYDLSQNNDSNIRIQEIEPDFNQSGEMFVEVFTKAYPNSPAKKSEPIFFDPTTEKLNINIQGRLMYFKFTSNVSNGFYQLGKTFMNFQIGDERPS
jgi:hypothetical protein